MILQLKEVLLSSYGRINSIFIDTLARNTVLIPIKSIYTRMNSVLLIITKLKRGS